MICTMVGLLVIACLGTAAASADDRRAAPAPLPGHPGNVFVAGESVVLAVPPSDTGWRVLDYEDREVGRVSAGRKSADLGKMPVGFYRLRRSGSEEWISFAVLERLKAPTPRASPICVDVAMAWFYPQERMSPVASLAALAGVNRVRDRLAWGEMEPERGRYSGPGKYDASALAQASSGLQVLQVNHSSPGWAGPDGRRFPSDLRDVYRFYREMAKRWEGRVSAFEPWNEADISAFGGHTGAEMAALQKASYLGLKAGNPGVTACLNVFASHVRAQLDDLADNEAWPYFDTYNLHHYEGFEGYPKLYADHRSASAGRPLWVTECAMPVKWAGDARLQEPSEADLREQSERIARVYAGSLHEGSAATFYFILGHYVEGQTQFGIIRRDLTPRPAYVALAAVGRMLADARPLGRLRAGDGVCAYAFRARPDGNDRIVVVAWARDGRGSLALPGPAESALDHLGRPLKAVQHVALSTAPVFCVLPASARSALSAEPPPRTPRRLGGSPSKIVIQPIFSADRTLLWASALRVSGAEPTTMRLAVYNFGPTPAAGRISARAPDGWRIGGLRPLRLEPMGRVEMTVTLHPPVNVTRTVVRVRFIADLGSAGKATASVRIAPDSSALSAKPGAALKGAEDPASWNLLVSGGPTPTAVKDDQGLVFEAVPTGDPWFYPRISVSQPVPRRAAGLACTITLLEGEGLFRAIFDERNGSGYVADFVKQPRLGEATQTVAILDGAVYGAGWSQPDPNGKLDIADIVTLKIGCNTRPARVRFRVSDIRWVME